MRRVLIVELGYEFDSIQDCVNYLEGDYRSVMRVLNGDRPTYRGYRIEYIREGRRVLEPLTGTVYNSAKEAIEDLELDASSAYKVLRGERFQHKNHPIRYIL